MNYNQLGIYELRNVAREIGVKRPTTFKKADLIEQIEQIETGELKPYVKKTKQGRPAKQITSQFIFQNLSDEEKVKLINEHFLKDFSPKTLLSMLNVLNDFYTQSLTLTNNTISLLKKLFDENEK